jgi:regulator of protease activity HflC (stomatin/prohibitin superfamily)
MNRLRRSEAGQASGGAVAVGCAAVAAVLVVLVWLIMFMGGWKSVPPDKFLLHYTGGPVQGTHFKEEVNPGTHTKFYGLLENYYYLPATQRNYIISGDPNRGDRHGVDTIVTPSADRIPMTVEASVYFKLNTRTDDVKGFQGGTLRRFFEQICLHTDCTDLSPGGGWDKMLDQFFRPQIDQALRLEIGKYAYQQEWQDPDTRLAIQKAVGPVLKESINSKLGGEFFCGPDSGRETCTDFGFVLQGVNPPAQVQDAFRDTAASQQRVHQAEQDAAAKIAAANGDAESQRIRATAPPVPPQITAYIKAQAEQACAGNPNCKLVIVDGTGTTVQVPTG